MLKKILDYAYSDETVVDPPNLTGHSEEEVSEDDEIKQVTVDDIYRNIDESKNPLENKELEPTTKILKQTFVFESLSDDANR